MASSEDFKRIRALYQKHGAPRGITIESFCKQNGIVFEHYDRWLREHAPAKICPVRIVGKDNISEQIQSQVQANPVHENKNRKAPARNNKHKEVKATSFNITVKTNNGLVVHQRNLTYQQLSELVTNLKVLC